MKVKELFEGISQIVYHYTKFHGALDILQDNQFRLSSDLGDDNEMNFRKGHKVFYMSTARTNTAAFHQGRGDGVMFVLDGRKLGQRYHGKPVDFFQSSDRREQGAHEQEDRIFYEKPYIPNAKNYIREAHVIIDEKYLRIVYPEKVTQLRRILIELKRSRIDTYVYTDRQDWLRLNKRKALPQEEFANLIAAQKDAHDDREPMHDNKYSLSPWLELFHKKRESDLSKEAKDVLKGIMFPDAWEDFQKALFQTNKRDHASHQNMAKAFREVGVRSAEEFVEYLINKWHGNQYI